MQLIPGQSMSNRSLQRHLCGEETNIFLTPEHCNLMCNCNGIPSCEEKHWSLHQSFVLQWALSAIAMELYHGQSTFNPSALKRASCLICGATQGNKAALAGNLTQAFCQRPWLRKKRDFFLAYLIDLERVSWREGHQCWQMWNICNSRLFAPGRGFLFFIKK